MKTSVMMALTTSMLLIHSGKQSLLSSRCVCQRNRVLVVLTCWHALQICMSPQARAFFCAMCSQVSITLLELPLWICTWWGSLFKFLDHFILLKLVCATFIYLFRLISHSITGNWSIHSPCRHKWEHAKSDKAAELHWLSFDLQRLGVPQGHPGCAHGKFSLTCCLPGSCCVEAIKCPADIFKWARTHCLAHHPELQIPYQALGNDGHTFALSRAHKSTWQRHQESLQVVWPSWQYFLQRTLYVLIGFSLILQHQANVSLQVLYPNVMDMYFQHWWDTERYSAGMKQLEDAVHCFLPFIIALGLLTTLVSLTGITVYCACAKSRNDRRDSCRYVSVAHFTCVPHWHQHTSFYLRTIISLWWFLSSQHCLSNSRAILCCRGASWWALAVPYQWSWADTRYCWLVGGKSDWGSGVSYTYLM